MLRLNKTLARSSSFISSHKSTRLISTSQALSNMSPAPTKAPTWSDWRLSPPSSAPPTAPLYDNSNLPHLPVPELDVTMKKVMDSVKALGSEKELKELEEKKRKFEESGLAAELQKRLEARRDEPGMINWIAEWWDNDAYMSYRDSVVVNVSYYYGFNRLPQSPPSLPQKVDQDQGYVGASIVATALEFRNLIAKGVLETEKGLCMESYKWAYNACRIPASPADYATKVPELSPEAQHFVVVHKGVFWKVDINDKNGKSVGVQGWKESLSKILDGGKSVERNEKVGILTGVNRDSWTEARTHLIENKTNAITLALIEQSAFVLSLDDASPSPSPTSSNGITTFSERIWKGGLSRSLRPADEGAEGEAGNRWWDKPLQWIVFRNGESGFVGEHSCMDGTPTARMNDFLSKRLLSDSPEKVGVDKATFVPEPVELKFELDGKAKEMIKSATAEFGEHVEGYKIWYLRYDKYGKDGIKKMGVSPDAWTQMIFQLAYYLTHGAPCGTYEAAQVRRFQLGRTETIRICTNESVKFTKAMVDGKVGAEEKKRLFKEAVGRHGKEAKEAAAGMGVDRHLFGLKKFIKGDEEENAAFLRDGLLAKSGTWNMSTSQIYIRNAPAYGWGPVATEGYGLPYMIHPECLQFTVSAHEDRMPGGKFIKNIEKAADMIMEMMETSGKM